MTALPRLALLGTGAMGSRVGAHLLAAGYPLAVYNRTRASAESLIASGAQYCATPREAAASAEIVIAYVRDDGASRKVWLDPIDGALHALSASAIAIESSSLSPEWVKSLAASVSATGARFLEAPVAGSRPQAESKNLVSLVGGDAAVLEIVRPVLATASSKIFHVGPTGAGAALKLGVNAFLATQVAGVAELFANMTAFGIAGNHILEIISELPTTSNYIKAAGALMVANNDAPLFTVELVAKDLRYADELAQQQALQLTILQSVRALFERAAKAGLADKNLTAISTFVAKKAQ